MSLIMKEIGSIQMNAKFWNNSFMNWFEKKLLSFTSWFWEKRKQAQQKPMVRVEPVLDDSPSNTTTKKTSTRKTSTSRASSKKTISKNKDEWSVK